MHALHLSLQTSFKELLNKGKKALKTLFDNQGYTPKDLQTQKAYQDLIESTTNIFKFAIADNDVSETMQRALEQDAFLFGSLKANAQLFEASKLLKNPDGTLKSFQQLTQDFDKLNTKYNRDYLEAEYEFAVGSAEMAGKWESFEDSDRYFLQYRTAKDERVRASHAALADITLPKQDPFWDSYLAPNGWRCRCQTVQVLASDYNPSNAADALKKGETATTEIGKNGKNRLEIFRFNPGKNQVLFPPKHPYNKVAGAKEVKEKVEKWTQVKTQRGNVFVSSKHFKNERKENIEIASYLANKYSENIDLIAPKINQKTADSFNKTRNVYQEYKRNNQPTVSAIDNAIRTAANQANHIVLDIKSKIDDGMLRNAIQSRVNRAKNIKEIIVIRNGDDKIYLRVDIIKKDWQL